MQASIDEGMFPEIWHIIFRKCSPSWEMPEHQLAGCNLSYVIQGDARYHIDGKVTNMTAGDLLVLPRGTVRKAITFPDRLMQCFSVDFDLKTIGNRELQPPFPAKSSPGCHENIIHLFHELSFCWTTKAPGYVIKCRGLFLLILHQFLEQVVYQEGPFVGDSRITKIIRYIAIHYAEHISAKMMAEIVGLNPTYFGLLFRQTMGVSFNTYLIQTRVNNAEIMLSTGEYKVGDIAEVCGFTDVSHFYKHFKNVKGFPPSHSLPKKF